MHLSNFFQSSSGKYMLSLILGLGLASLFRTVCKEKNCIIFKAPPIQDMKDKTFRYDNKCYKYKPTLVKCESDKKIISF